MAWLEFFLDGWLLGRRHWRLLLGWGILWLASEGVDLAEVDWGGWPWFLFCVLVLAATAGWDLSVEGWPRFRRPVARRGEPGGGIRR